MLLLLLLQSMHIVLPCETSCVSLCLPTTGTDGSCRWLQVHVSYVSPDTLLVMWVVGESDTGPDPQLPDVKLFQGQVRVAHLMTLLNKHAGLEYRQSARDVSAAAILAARSCGFVMCR